MKTRYAIWKHGYITDDGREDPPNTFVRAYESLEGATGWLGMRPKGTKSDYFIRQEEHDGIDWVGIEGTEILQP